MQYFFIQAKVVGTLTGVFLAQLDGQFSGRQRRGWLAGFRNKTRTVKGYRIARRPAGGAVGRLVRAGSGPAARDIRGRRRGRGRAPPRYDAHGQPRRQADRQQGAHRSARQRPVHGPADQPQRIPRQCPALAERGGRVRPLRARFRPGQRADAVRHVSPLHGRRAHHPRDRAARPAREGRAEGRSSAGGAHRPRYPVAPGALCRGAAARHRQGARRRSFGDRRRDRPEARARGSGSTRTRPSWSAGWCAITCCSATPR